MFVIRSFTLVVFLLHISEVTCGVYYIIPSSSYPCYFDSCVTLSTYITRYSASETSNTTLFIAGGNYNLFRQQFSVRNVGEFTLRAVNDTDVSVNIFCDQFFTLQISSVGHVYIEGVTFVGCASSSLESVQDGNIVKSLFVGQGHFGSALAITNSSVTISGTGFIANQEGSLKSNVTLLNLLTSQNNSQPNSPTALYRVGGALIVTLSTVVINDSSFVDNEANIGGAIFTQEQSNVSINNSVFSSNHATGCISGVCVGGALFVYTGSHMLIDNTTFQNNTSDQDGGIAALLSDATLTVSHSFITNSFTRRNGGTVTTLQRSSVLVRNTTVENSHASADGGVFYVDRNSSLLVDDNSTLSCNSAANRGGVIFAQSLSNISIESSTFLNNTAASGAVLFINVNANATMSNSTVFGNKVRHNGGVVFMAEQSISTITGSEFYGNEAEHGGVVFVRDSGCELTVGQSYFHHNRVMLNGGAIHFQRGSFLEISESSFDSNYANREGGVIYGLAIERCEVYRSNFSANIANIGGVVAARDGSNFLAQDCVFHNNVNVDLGGVVFSDNQTNINVTFSRFFSNAANYGGVSHTTRNSSVYVSNCEYINNTANIDGATVYGRARSPVLIANSTFTNNMALNDGIVLVYDSSIFSLRNTSFSNNTVGHDGGAVYLYKGLLYVTDSTFTRNRAENSGGAIYGRSNTTISVSVSSFFHNTAQTSGGALHIQDDSRVLLDRNSFSNSSANSGGVLHIFVNSTAVIFESIFNHNIAYQDGGVVSAYNNSTLTVDGSNFTFNTGDYAGAVEGFQNCTLEFRSCNFSSNIGKFEGIVRVRQGSSLFIAGGNFTNNSAQNGGSIFTQGSIVTVNSTLFTDNSASKKAGVIFSNGNSIIDLHLCTLTSSIAFDDGGVMSLLNGTFATITSCVFANSVAQSNGGVIGIEYSGISVLDSLFMRSAAGGSGGVVRAINSSVELNGSLFIFSSAGSNGGVITARMQSSIIILNSNFTDNQAGASGGVLHLEQQSNGSIAGSMLEMNSAVEKGGAIAVFESCSVRVTGTTFECNKAQNGGAIASTSSSLYFYVQSEDISTKSKNHIHNNTAMFSGGGISLSASSIDINAQTEISQNVADGPGGGISAMSNSSILFNQYVNFTNNQVEDSFGGAIFAQNTTIMFGNSVDFVSNEAKFGGAVSLSNSVFQDSVVSSDILRASFISNCAKFGGALYVVDQIVCNSNEDVPGCFFQGANQLRFVFMNNSASLLSNNTGRVLYGGLLDRCTVEGDTNNSTKSLGVSHFLNISDLTSINSIYSGPVRVCPCTNGEPLCSEERQIIQVKQGNRFTVGPIVPVDQVGHPVGASVNSFFSDASISALLPANQMVQTVSSSCSSLNYLISFPSAPERYNLILYADGPCADSRESRFTVEVQVERCSCPIGFTRNNRSTTCNCVCDTDTTFSRYVSECDILSESVVRDGRYWISYIVGDNSSSTSGSYIFYDICPLDYCLPPTSKVLINLNLPDGPDAQCANNRSGLLCGQCNLNDTLSLSLGSTRCIRCPERWYTLMAGIILVAIFAGLGMVISLLVLNLTVAVGTLNSIIFFANIIFANRSLYFRQVSLTFVPVFISWLNLEIGLDTCFYEGMDAYAKTWLQLAFPLYLFFLVIMVILVSSCSSKFSNLLGKKDPVATLATLILLSYTKLLEVIVATLSYVNLNFPNGTQEVRWLPDASVKYPQGKHIGLICAAILVITLGLIYTTLLTSWQWLLRCSSAKVFCCTRNQKLHSFIDTYHSPHTSKHRYWTGLLLLIRVIVYLISSFSLAVDPRITLLSTIVVVSSLLAYKTVFMIKVYRNWLLNSMESFVHFNIITFTLFTWYTFDDSQNRSISGNKEILQQCVAYISVGTILVLLLLIIGFHVYRYGSSKLYSIGKDSKIGRKAFQKLNVMSDKDSSTDGTILDAVDELREYCGGYQPPARSEISMSDCEELPLDLVNSTQSHQTGNTSQANPSHSGGRDSNCERDIKGKPSRSQTQPVENKQRWSNPRLLSFTYGNRPKQSITVPLLEEEKL